MAHHEFSPDHYHNTIGWHEPVLEIAPGDSVATTTVDARGQDRHGEKVAERGNPMTGPFYITGAEEGDTFAVTFDKLYPNRDWGWTGRRIAPNVLDPGFETGFVPDDEPLRWAVDLEAGTTTQARARPCPREGRHRKPGCRTRLRNCRCESEQCFFFLVQTRPKLTLALYRKIVK